jgi:hypothetical protein
VRSVDDLHLVNRTQWDFALRAIIYLESFEAFSPFTDRKSSHAVEDPRDLTDLSSGTSELDRTDRSFLSRYYPRLADLFSDCRTICMLPPEELRTLRTSTAILPEIVIALHARRRSKRHIG